MNTRLFRFLGLATLAIALSGCASLDGTSGSHLTNTEKMMWSTYALVTPRGMATCFIVNRRDRSAPGGVLPLLVTSAHVLASAPGGPYYLVVRTPQSGDNPAVDVLEIVSAMPKEQSYFRHPSQDIAVLELPIPAELASEVSLTSFIDEEALGRGSTEARIGDEMTILGFPHVWPGTSGGFAVLRSGKMASYSVGTQTQRERFLVNTSVFGGDSGAPVFAVNQHGHPQLVGMITDRAGDKEGKVPLAVAVSAPAIRETLELQALSGRVIVGEAETVTSSKSHRRPSFQIAGAPVPLLKSAIAERVTHPAAP
jgi:hypothetical protein